MSITGTEDTDRLVLLEFDPQDIWRVAQVSTRLSRLCRGLWRHLVWRDFQINREYGPYNEQYRYLSVTKFSDVLKDGRIDGLELIHRKESVCGYEAVRACEYGHLEMLKWILDQGVRPGRETIETAITTDHHEIVDYLWRLGVRPRWDWIAPPSLAMTQRLMTLGLTPDDNWANAALFHKSIELLDFYYQRGVLPEPAALEISCEFDCCEMVVWMWDHGVVPSQECATIASIYNQTRIVEYLSTKGIHPAEDPGFF